MLKSKTFCFLLIYFYDFYQLLNFNAQIKDLNIFYFDLDEKD